MKELILGAGSNKIKKMWFGDNKKYSNPTYLDIDPRTSPDILWDLNQRPLPFEDESFDEIHAYEVLEHIGKQGDWRGFFEEWNEYYRILKPGGYMFCTCPSIKSIWLWGDPGHTRVISDCTITFLSQAQYEKQIGVTSMTDYRDVYDGDFKVVSMDDNDANFLFVLEKV